MRIRRKFKEIAADHDSVSKRLDKQELETQKMERRVKLLEIEAGIFRPDLREVNGT